MSLWSFYNALHFICTAVLAHFKCSALSNALCNWRLGNVGWARSPRSGFANWIVPPSPVPTIQPSLKCSNIWTICGFLARKYSSGWCWANMGELGKLCRRQTFVLKTTFKSASAAKPCVELRDTWHKLQIQIQSKTTHSPPDKLPLLQSQVLVQSSIRFYSSISIENWPNIFPCLVEIHISEKRQKCIKLLNLE